MYKNTQDYCTEYFNSHIYNTINQLYFIGYNMFCLQNINAYFFFSALDECFSAYGSRPKFGSWTYSESLTNFMNLLITTSHCFDECTKNSICYKRSHL